MHNKFQWRIPVPRQKPGKPPQSCLPNGDRERPPASLTSSPEAVAQLRFLQIAAYGFPGLHSSEMDSQHGDGFWLPTGKHNPWPQYGKTLSDTNERSSTKAVFKTRRQSRKQPAGPGPPLSSPRVTTCCRFSRAGAGCGWGGSADNLQWIFLKGRSPWTAVWGCWSGCGLSFRSTR